jgi:putative transposase
MLLNYKFEIYPTIEQQEKLNLWISFCRQQYNSALLDKSNAYENKTINFNRKMMQSQLTLDKKVFSFLKEMPSQPLQEVFARLEKSFNNFFRKKTKYPKIKKYKDYNSLTFPQFGMGIQNQKNAKTGLMNKRLVRRAISLGKRGNLLISKLGLIPMVRHRNIDGKVKQVVIKRQGNKWFAIFCVERHVTSVVSNIIKMTALDVGINKFAVLANGEEIQNPKFLRKEEKKLKKAQQKLSCKVKGSNNFKKQVTKVQQIHKKVANQRKDFLHKQSFCLSKDYNLIFVEDLKITNMVKNRKLAKSIHDAGWGMFRDFLTYKLTNNGGQLIKVKPHYTSQDCSSCGTRIKKSLSIRTHICTNCGLVLDRDHNAALNIQKIGLSQM